MRFLIVIIFLISTFVTVPAQSSREQRAGVPVNEVLPPTLQTAPLQRYTDELYVWGTQKVFLRSGQNIQIPLSDSPSLQMGLEAPLSTKGMSNTTINRLLTMRVDILTKYGDKLAVKDAMVETRITGQSAGFKRRALLMIEPRTIQFKSITPILVGIAADGKPIYLKPGVWLLRLHCTIQSIEAENMHWYPSDDTESVTVKGKRFGSSSAQNSYSDPYQDLQYINPLGPFLYSMTKIGKFVALLIRRPNIDLPASTQLFFRIDRIEATYLAPIPPADALQVRQ